MKASEILRRYDEGERDFRRTNLRGQSFKGQDLSGADFSEADIRGASFSNATLKGATFAKAKTGQQKRWVVSLVAMAFLLSTLSAFVLVLGALRTKFSIFASLASYNDIILLIILAQVAIFSMLTVLAGFQVALGVGSVISAIAWSVAKGLALVTSSFPIQVSMAVQGGILGGTVNAIWVVAATAVVATSILVTVTTIDNKLVAIAFASAVIVGGDAVGTFAVAIATSGVKAEKLFLNSRGVTVVGLLAVLVARNTLAGNKKFDWIQKVAIALATLGGTSFSGSDLTKANFTKVNLKSANFWQANLTHVYWKDATKLDRARLGNSILSNPSVRELLVTRSGYKKSYVDANLRGANLNGVDFNEANLKWADLSEATLHHANLRGANLTETLVLGADFTGASLTGACLEAWNIDHNTKLDRVDCQYVYLLRNQQERRPSSGDFAPGEFTKLFQEVLSTVDLIFRNGIDWKAFAYSFNQLVLENEGTELSIQSIENKGDGVVVVRVNAPPDADKAKLHSEFNQTYDMAVKALEARYHAELQAKDDQITIYRQQSADMLEITRLMANRPINVQAIAEAKTMTNSNDSSQTMNIGGNVTGSTLNLEISGAVTNTINQLPSSPDPAQPGIKELLTQLQAAIEAAHELSPEDKADALEQVKVVAELGQNPQNPEKEGIWRKAVKILKAPIPGLPETATIVKAFGDILPAIAKLLSLAV